jgi:hypothetical protein
MKHIKHKDRSCGLKCKHPNIVSRSEEGGVESETGKCVFLLGQIELLQISSSGTCRKTKN